MTVSAASERNKEPILEVLKLYLSQGEKSVLEIGSGGAVHVQFFSRNLPQTKWQPSEVGSQLGFLTQQLHGLSSERILSPIEYEIGVTQLTGNYDAVYTANTFHIMTEDLALRAVQAAAQLLTQNGHLMVYGPFKYDGEFTTESNARFNEHLKMTDPRRGIRDFEKIAQQAEESGLQLVKDHSMPANNQLLVFFKP